VCSSSIITFHGSRFTAVREAFSSAYPDKEMPKSTSIHQPVTAFRDTRGARLRQVLIELQNS
jgi:hypothetical protein